MSAPVRHLWVLIGNVIVPSLAWAILVGLGWFRDAAGVAWQEHWGAWAFMAMPLWVALILAWGRGSSKVSVAAGFGLAYALLLGVSVGVGISKEPEAVDGFFLYGLGCPVAFIVGAFLARLWQRVSRKSDRVGQGGGPSV